MSSDTALADLVAVKGIKLGTSCANIKQANRRDLVVIELSANTHCAAVFTQNVYCAAPVQLAKQYIKQTNPRYLLINTGNANAGTGQRGLDNAKRCCARLAALTQCHVTEVLPFSTGVIGEDLQVDKILSGIPVALNNLTENGWHDAAQGIMTTDTVAKGGSRQITIDNKIITITAIAKGSGMIRPDMATMLAYIATDAKISAQCLQQCLHKAVAVSFNRITVDGDTSTNDACVLIATGQADIEINNMDSEAMQMFLSALTELCVNLAKDMIRDGEGATKLITLEINGGKSEQECLDVAYTVAHSPLVKTAFFASDPNWGRILAAIGRVGLTHLHIEHISIYMNDVCIVSSGERDSAYTEQAGQQIMQNTEIIIRIELSRGTSTATVWTCDFSYDYVKINAEYRT